MQVKRVFVAIYTRVKNGHDVKTLLRVNEKYTIHSLGTICKQVQSNCFLCRTKKGVQLVQQMATLPITIIKEKIKAFENYGMDFAGPFEAKVECSMACKKLYIFVITLQQELYILNPQVE
jgi:hypothetical protein